MRFNAVRLMRRILFFILFFSLATAPVYAKDSYRAPAKGFPVWAVNKINLNLFVTDIPLWYTPAYGPEVEIQLSYNSQAGVIADAPFGTKWQFNYEAYITEDQASGTVRVIMPDGREDLFTPDGQGGYTRPAGKFGSLTKTAPERFELQLLSGRTYVFQIPSNTSLTYPCLVQIKDAYNQALTIGYNAQNKLSSITDAQGRTTTIVYTGGLITGIIDPFQRSASFGYTNNELTSITDMAGYVAELAYQTSAGDNQRYIASITNKGLNGLSAPETWAFKIEPNDGINNNSDPYPAPDAAMWENYRITITDPSGSKEEYYAIGPYTWHVSPNDYVSYVNANTNNYTAAKKTLYYLDWTDPKGRINKIVSPEGGYTRYENFDAITNKPQKVTHYHGKDANNQDILHVDEYTYNANGRILTQKDPRGKTTTNTYYPNNIDLLSITNPLGSISFTYNGATHDIASITDRLGNITELTYNPNGQMTSITEAKNTPIQTITELVYDAVSHNLTEIKKGSSSQALSTIASLTYDSKGRVWTQTDATGITTTLEYNNLDKVTKVTFPDTRFIQINRSTLHPNLIDSVTDRGGQTTSYTHDELNRLKQISGPQGIYNYEYDKNGNMTKLIDANRTPNVETIFEYNLDNQLKKKTYADGNDLTYAYDKAGLLKTATNARNIATTYTYDQNHNLLKTDYADTTPDVTNTYDDYNRLWTRTDSTGLTTYGYDNNGRLISVDGPYSNDNITYQYDELNRVKALLPQTGQALSYVYDSLGRLRDIQAGSNTFTYDYSGVSQLIQSLTRPNGSYTEYLYNDPLKKLTSVINKKSTGDVINRFEYTYNNRDLIETEAITNGQIIDNFIIGTTTETPNILNQIMSRSAQGQTKTYVYDLDGNLAESYTADGYKLFMTYDAQNRMKSAQYADGSSVTHRNEYNYAGNSLLAELKKYDAGSLTATTKYLRSGFLPMQERDAANTVAREYTWGLNLGGGIGGLLNLRQAGADYSYLYDGKGNVSALIDSSQSVVASYVYDPFGRLMSKSGALDQPYTFSTKDYDSRTGLNYYGYRFYDSCSGKWTTRDPLEETGGMNLYGAMNNNSVNFVDPSGLLMGYSGVKGYAQIMADTTIGIHITPIQLIFHNSAIKYASSKHGVDPNLIRAIVFEEQTHLYPPLIEDFIGGDTIGMGQISSRNWAKYGEGCLNNRWNPAKNIEGMAKMLSDLQNVYQTKDIRVLGARYNNSKGELQQKNIDYGTRVNGYYNIFKFLGLGILPVGGRRKRKRQAYFYIAVGIVFVVLLTWNKLEKTIDFSEELPIKINGNNLVYGKIEAHLPDILYKKYRLAFVTSKPFIEEKVFLPKGTYGTAIDSYKSDFFYLIYNIDKINETEQKILKKDSAVSFLKFKGNDGHFYLFTASGETSENLDMYPLTVRLHKLIDDQSILFYDRKEMYSVDPGYNSNYCAERIKLFLYRKFSSDERYK